MVRFLRCAEGLLRRFSPSAKLPDSLTDVCIDGIPFGWVDEVGESDGKNRGWSHSSREIRERGAPARNLARSPMNYSPLSFQQLLAMYDSMLLTAGALHLLAMGMDEEHRASLAA